MTPRFASSFFVGLAFASLVSVSSRASSVTRDDDNLREDVLACEDAASHVRTCCSQSLVVSCRYDYMHVDNSYSCDGTDDDYTTTVRPDLDLAEARCVLASSCADLRARGVCDRIAKLEKLRHDETSRGSGYSSGAYVQPAPAPPVCP